MPEQLLTPEQAAERLQIAPKTVRDMLRRGKLPGGVKFGSKLWRIREADLDAYIRGLGSRQADEED